MRIATTLKIFGTLFLMVFLLTPQQSFAQNYETAVGLRAGYGLGVTGKHFFGDALAVEGIIRYRRTSTNLLVTNVTTNFFTIQALGQFHNDLDDVLSGLSWYYGGGAIVSFGSVSGGGSSTGSTAFGISGNIGLDIALGDLPLNISLDWIPTFFLSGGSSFLGGNGGIAVRYILP